MVSISGMVEKAMKCSRNQRNDLERRDIIEAPEECSEKMGNDRGQKKRSGITPNPFLAEKPTVLSVKPYYNGP
ncbi:hypothetical protein [Peribacillus kribbensis]|uniref:hypothetical protein n=1 Tax=Peribacillus kribbensis TaxID=356658 RepID=UPI0003F74BA4|nr:hypothetical protein [Peribacillus kribbensis]